MTLPVMKAPAFGGQQQQRPVELGQIAGAPHRHARQQPLAGLARQKLGVDLGREVARRDGVDADAVARQLQRHRLGEAHHRRLRCRVGRQRLDDAEAQDRGDVDDGAAGAVAPTMRRAASWPTRNTPSRLTAMTSRHSSSLVLTKKEPDGTPALLMRIVTGPAAASAASKARTTEAWSVTSSATAQALPPAAWISASSWRRRSSRRARQHHARTGAGQNACEMRAKPRRGPGHEGRHPCKRKRSVRHLLHRRILLPPLIAVPAAHQLRLRGYLRRAR